MTKLRISMKRAEAPRRTNDPERVRADILAIATEAFARDGLAGARVDEIAERTRCSKRMIYYYFGGKEGLYRAVLEACYARIAEREREADLSSLPPLKALQTLVEFTFDYHRNNPGFVRLVMAENINMGVQIHELESVKMRAQYAIKSLAGVLTRGMAAGVMRKGLSALDLHMTISALCFYNVSNANTVAHVFDHDMASERNAKSRRKIVVDTVLRWVAP